MLTVGHRGASGDLPENTMGSFAEALKRGATAIELDVHRCKSGEMVVIHDEDVSRTTSGSGKVSELTLAELKKFDAGNGEQIPTLDEVLELVNRKASIFIELKSPGAKHVAATIHDAVENKGWKYDQLPVIGFNHRQLYAFKRQNPDIEIGATIHKKVKTVGALTLMAVAKRMGASAINPDHRLVTPSLVRKAHANGMKVNVWTVNEPKDIRRMLDAGVDAIMSDYPERIAQVKKLYPDAGRDTGTARHS